MVRGAICFKKNLELAGIEEKMDAKYYVEVLRQFFPIPADVVLGGKWIFQQNNDAVHSSP